jgi:hypothetical protein
VQEPHNAHRGFAWFVVWSLIAQVAMGVYLKLHLEKGINGRIRPLFVTAHRCLGILVPVIGYTQIVLVSDASLLICKLSWHLTIENRVSLLLSAFAMAVSIFQVIQSLPIIFA